MISRLTSYFFRGIVKDGDAFYRITMTLHPPKVFDIHVAVGLRIHTLNTTLYCPRKLHIKTGKNLCHNCINIFP